MVEETIKQTGERHGVVTRVAVQLGLGSEMPRPSLCSWSIAKDSGTVDLGLPAMIAGSLTAIAAGAVGLWQVNLAIEDRRRRRRENTEFRDV